MKKLREGDTYTLTEADLALVRDEARRRAAISRQHVGGNYRNTTDDDEMTASGNAIGAEIALAVLTSGWWFHTCEPVEGKPDIYLRDGQTLDAKATEKPKGRLQVSTEASARPDHYMLLIGQLPTYRWSGYATAAELRRPELIHKMPRYGWAYVLPQARLHHEFDLP